MTFIYNNLVGAVPRRGKCENCHSVVIKIFGMVVIILFAG